MFGSFKRTAPAMPQSFRRPHVPLVATQCSAAFGSRCSPGRLWRGQAFCRHLSFLPALPARELEVALHQGLAPEQGHPAGGGEEGAEGQGGDRKSTRLNSSHVAISYAVFCLKKKNKTSELTQG